MSDKQPNPAPDGKPAGDDPLGALVSNSIDDLLAEAQSLASAVAHEVGVSEPAPKPPQDANQTPDATPLPDTASPPGAPEAALAAMEDVLAESVVEDPSPEPTPASSTVDDAIDAAMAETPVDDVPAAESGEPKPDADTMIAAIAAEQELTQETTAAVPDSPALGGITFIEEPVAPDDQAIIEEEIAAATGDMPAEPESQAEAPPTPQPTAPGRLGRLAQRVTHGLKSLPRGIAATPYWALVGVLWLIDLPFAWMSPALKSKLGYVGLVTALMATIAWAMVLMGLGG